VLLLSENWCVNPCTSSYWPKY